MAGVFTHRLGVFADSGALEYGFAGVAASADKYLPATTVILDASDQSDGTGYTTENSYWGRTISYAGTAAIASGVFVFDGNSDYVDVANTNQLHAGRAMTLELTGVVFDSLPTDGNSMTLASVYAATSRHSWVVDIENTAGVYTLRFRGSSTTAGAQADLTSFVFTPTISTVYAFQCGWDGSNAHIYINGERVAQTAYTAGLADSSASFRLGADDGDAGATPRNFFHGKIESARYTINQDRTAGASTYAWELATLPLVKGNFGTAHTNPTFSNVAFRATMDGSDAATTFTDSGSVGVSPTFVANAQLDTAEKKFGTASLLLDGTGDYVALGDDVLFRGTNGTDIVAEGWVYLNADDTGNYTIFSKRPTSGSATEWQFMVANRRLQLYLWQSGSVVTGTKFTPPIPPGRWVYVAAERIGTAVRVIIDGITVDEGTQTGTVSTSTNSLDIGRDRDFGGREWEGWIDDLRITRSEDFLPSGNFDPPTSAMPTS